MARFARDRRLIEAVLDGVSEPHRIHAAEDHFGTHDLINWLNANRPTELNDLYDLYHDCADPEMTANQQIGKFLYTLGQVKVDEQVSSRRIDRRGGGNRNGTCSASVWEVSERTREGLAGSRETLFGPEGFFDRIAAEPPIVASPNWIDQMSGTFADNPVFAEMIRLGREFRESYGPEDEP